MSKLRVLWIPQVGINETFYVPVNTPGEGKELGLDITTYFTMAAKQAIRERRIPFEITTNANKESEEKQC